MSKAVVVNGSPRMEKGNTAMVLAPFIQGMKDAGCDVELFYAGKLKIQPCGCGTMYCWSEKPGECCINDDMELLYPKLKEADILVFATPVYIPLPGDMQNIINRLCPFLDPLLKIRDGRTRIRFHKDVKIKKIALVSVCGWWEKENMNTVLQIVKEFAAIASVEFVGAVLRPHAFLLKKKGELTNQGKEILDTVHKAGGELIKDGSMKKETLDIISRPLISWDEYLQKYK